MLVAKAGQTTWWITQQVCLSLSEAQTYEGSQFSGLDGLCDLEKSSRDRMTRQEGSEGLSIVSGPQLNQLRPTQNSRTSKGKMKCWQEQS